MLQVLQRAAKNAAAERKALLGGRSPADKQTKLQSDEDALNATQDITAGLQRTRQMLIQVHHAPLTAPAVQHGCKPDLLPAFPLCRQPSMTCHNVTVDLVSLPTFMLHCRSLTTPARRWQLWRPHTPPLQPPATSTLYRRGLFQGELLAP